jgi:hypothetical protein
LDPSVFFVSHPMIDRSECLHKVPHCLRHVKASRCRGLHETGAAAALTGERNL